MENLGSFNFDGVEVAGDKRFTKPGTKGVFQIAGLEFGKSKNKGAAYMKVKFEDKESSFNDSFYFVGANAEKTKAMLSRIQTLVYAASQSKLTGNITQAQLEAKLLGKKLGLKVSGEVANNGKGYPKLSFGGFAVPEAEVEFLEFNSDELKAIDAALEAIANSSSNNSDGEDGGHSDAPNDEFIPPVESGSF